MSGTRQPSDSVTLFLAGDLMTGRGVDQILPVPSAPGIFESYLREARVYVWLAEEASGPIPRPVSPTYIWGDALEVLAQLAPDARIINLETSVTRCDAYWPGKGINYRMHPGNVACLTAAGIDVCVLANNHVLDYGYAGLNETLATLAAAGIQTAGAGRHLAEACRPTAVKQPGGGRVLVAAFGTESSGIPPEWAATADRPGVHVLEDLSDATCDAELERLERERRPGDLVVASIHWGGNWGYEVPDAHVRFAHRLIDGGVAIVHGHSSHHPRPIEVYRGRLVLYGCGDFLDDYEGITGYEEFRNHLVLGYFPAVDPVSGALRGLRMTPFRIRRMRLEWAAPDGAGWLRDVLVQASARFGTQVELGADRNLILR